MVTTFYPPFHFGGDATYVRALSMALAARGHEVAVVHCEDAYALAGKAIETLPPPDEGIAVHRLKSRFGALSPLITQQTGRPGLKANALQSLLRQPFDVVHFHNISLIGGPAVLRLSQAPVTLYTLHEHWLLCPTHIFWRNRREACTRRTCFSCSLRSRIPPQLWRYTGLAKKAVAHVDALIAPSEFTARLHRDAGFRPAPVVLPLFSNLAPSDDGPPARPSRPRFLYVGRVTRSKGLVPLLATFARHPAYDLLVIGDGDMRPALQRQYAPFDHIRFLGPLSQPDLIAHYRAATALVFPSLAPETFGLSIVEALACGTPAIVRDAGGSREIIEATGGGVVYRDDDELDKALRHFAGDWQARCIMGARGREGVHRFYTKERHVNAYLALIAGLGQDKMQQR